MAPHNLHAAPPPGTSPGTLRAPPDARPPKVRVIAYNRREVKELEDVAPQELPGLLESHGVVWMDVSGLADVELVRALGEIFALHPLCLEDVLNVFQRGKVEVYDDTNFVVMRLPSYDEAHLTEQASLFFNDRVVLTFQERQGDCFDPVRQRIRNPTSRLRRSKADYLVYALLDATVDAFFPVVERHGDQLERFEDLVLKDTTPTTLEQIHGVRRELLVLKRVFWQARESVSALLREDTPFVQKETRIFVRDVQDHAIRLLELTEEYRDLSGSLMDLYMSTNSQRLNDVTKILTIIATIFIPLTFIAGIYGMNFDPEASPWNMPELSWRYGYPICLAAMLLIGVLLLAFFRRKRWL